MKQGPAIPDSAGKARPAALVVLLLAVAACAPRAGGTRAPRPIALPAAQGDEAARPAGLLPTYGRPSDRDAVVRIVGPTLSCSGALIEANLVLTAHHCVSARDAGGRVEPRDVDPKDLTVEIGSDYLPWTEVGVRAVVSPDCGYGAGLGDLAVLVLERRVVGLPTLVPRLDHPPSPGELIEPLGFGRCALSREGIKLALRGDGRINAVDAAQFQAQVPICPGDSGGPAVRKGGVEVLGVISASVMDADERTAGRTHFTRLDTWRELFAAARAIGDGATPSEVPPFRSCAR